MKIELTPRQQESREAFRAKIFARRQDYGNYRRQYADATNQYRQVHLPGTDDPAIAKPWTTSRQTKKTSNAWCGISMYITYKFAGFKELFIDGDFITFENTLERVPPLPDYMKVLLEC